eukprot:307198_1
MGCCFSHKEVSSTNVDLDDVDEFLIDPESLKNEPFDSLSSKKGWWTWWKPLTILLCCFLLLFIVITHKSSQNLHNGSPGTTPPPPAPSPPTNQNSSQNLPNGSSEVSSPASAPPPPTNQNSSQSPNNGSSEVTHLPPTPPLRTTNQNSSQNLPNGSSEVSSPASAPPPPTNQNSSQSPNNGSSEVNPLPSTPPLRTTNQNSSQNLHSGPSERSLPPPTQPLTTNTSELDSEAARENQDGRRVERDVSKPNKATEARCLKAYQKCEDDMNVRGKYFMSGSTKLYGVFLPAQTHGNESVPTIIYFYGYGGGTVRGSAYVVWQLWARLHRKVNVFVWDYRGFGLTGGIFPTESTMLDDSKAAFDYVLEQKEVDHEKVFAFGQAFGGAVAIQFVEKYWNLLAGAIFQNTFTEFSEKVSRTMPPELKSTEWKSIDRIGNIECPILMFSSQADKIVPPAMMLQLRKAAKKAKIVTIPKRGHKRAPLCSSKHGCTGNVKSCKRGFMCYWVQLREFINNPSAE